MILKEEKNIIEILKTCLEKDEVLIENHTCPIKTAQACARFTLDVLNENKKDWGEYNFYSLNEKKEIIGFIGVFLKEKILSTFMIVPKFRNSKTHQEFFKELRKLFKTDFDVYLYQKNIKARAYLEYNNAKVESINDKIVKYKICQ